jgi:DNA polymerase-3 subunit delta'
MSTGPFILGQPRAVQAMGRALCSGRMHHAWIFHGPRGTGKFRAAEALARILLDPASTAEHLRSLEPPRDTPVQRLIDAGTHPDLHVIRKELAAVSESRELRDRKQTNIPLDLLRERMLGGTSGDGRHHESAVFRTAALGHGKAFIVDEAELLDADAQNAMLKTLEEPPVGTVIVLVTQHEDRLLPTVRSRCQRVPFGPLAPEAMREWWGRSGHAPSPEDRAFADEFAEGAPGMAELALRHGLRAWQEELAPMLAEAESGGFHPAMADRMAALADGFASGIVDADERASKDAANRLAVRLMSRLLGVRIRRALHDPAASPTTLARWLGASDALHEFEQHIERNVNLKLAFANLSAQWAQRTAPSHGSTRAR